MPIRPRFFRDDYWKPQPTPGWETAIVLAGGSSVTPEAILATRGIKTVAVNSSYRGCLDADLLMFQDVRWWEREHREHFDSLSAFTGRIVTTKLTTPGYSFKLLRYNRRSPLTTLRPAILLAHDLGAKRIILMGADNRVGPNGRAHFHAEHPWPRPGGQAYWDDKYEHLSKLATFIRRRGVEVVNVSPISTLDFWPYTPLEEALRG